MTPPPGARRPEVRKLASGLVIIDDPMHGLEGDPGPIDRSKPDNFEMMIRRGDYLEVPAWKPGETKPRIAGTLVYSPKEDELGQVKCVEPSGIVQIWFGDRRPTGEEIIHNERACDLYVVQTKACNGCRGIRGEGGFSGWLPCKICNGLRTIPTREGLRPWDAEKRERRDRESL